MEAVGPFLGSPLFCGVCEFCLTSSSERVWWPGPVCWLLAAFGDTSCEVLLSGVGIPAGRFPAAFELGGFSEATVSRASSSILLRCPWTLPPFKPPSFVTASGDAEDCELIRLGIPGRRFVPADAWNCFLGAATFFFSRFVSDEVLRISTPAADPLPDETSPSSLPSSSANRAVGLGPDLESFLVFFKIGCGCGLDAESPFLEDELVDFESEVEDSSSGVLFVFHGGSWFPN